MRKTIIVGSLMVLPVMLMGQSALDAYQLGQSGLRGTARFMSMGGAFGALGGDLSTLNQNPAGIGVYRSSEIGATLDINMQSTKSKAQGYSMSRDQTKVACNNFGYVGAISLGSTSAMPFFNWGASYSRVASFDRAYRGGFNNLGYSLSNYVADYTTAANRWTPSQNGPISNNIGVNTGLGGDNAYNPFQDSYAPWMSILMYNAYAINPTSSSPDNTSYQGLFKNGTTGVGTFDVLEKGYVDEYSINFGGNVMNTVYWGVGFGITDISYTSSTYYTEDLNNANIPSVKAVTEDGGFITDGTETGNGGFGLDSYKHIYGTGFNFKAGVIVKPINELRLGLAVHTPTWYNMSYEGWAQVDYGYSSHPDFSGAFESDGGYYDAFDWKYRSPWRLIASAAGVIGGKGIVSVDYEYRANQSMSVKDNDGNVYEDIQGDIKNYYQSSNILRLGGEYRLNPNWSVRAGYSYESSPVKKEASDGQVQILTEGPDNTGTQPSYAFDNNTQYITCGVGFHYQNFYVDAAYVHRHRSSTFHAYDSFLVDGTRVDAPSAKITDSNNSLVFSLGFRF